MYPATRRQIEGGLSLAAGQETKLKRLNWGCGAWAEPGWINSDITESPGVDIVCDIREGLPLEDDSIDYAVSIHALPEIPYPELVPDAPGAAPRAQAGRRAAAGAAGPREGHRRLPQRRPRLLPGARTRNASSMGAQVHRADDLVRLLAHAVHTRVRSRSCSEKAGFASVRRMRLQADRGPYPEIVELDNRERESLFVEAVR